MDVPKSSPKADAYPRRPNLDAGTPLQFALRRPVRVGRQLQISLTAGITQRARHDRAQGASSVRFFVDSNCIEIWVMSLCVQPEESVRPTKDAGLLRNVVNKRHAGCPHLVPAVRSIKCGQLRSALP